MKSFTAHLTILVATVLAAVIATHVILILTMEVL